MALMLLWQTGAAVTAVAEGDAAPQAPAQENAAVSGNGELSAAADSYSLYAEKYKDVPYGPEQVLKPAADMTVQEFEGVPCAVDDGESPLTFRFHLDAAARYVIYVEYYTREGKSSNIERSLAINGEIPFSEASLFVLSRMYRDAVPYNNGFEFDERGNELRPTQEEVFGFQETALKSSTGYYNAPFSFYFPAGDNTLTFTCVREGIAISKITLKKAEELPGYREVKAGYDDQGLTAVEGSEPIKIQAENTYRKSTPTIYPISDRTSAASEPLDVNHILLNTIGSTNWKSAGEWLSWKLTVPKTGLYRIALRERQNLVSGNFVTRKLSINGVVPFAEAENLQFVYSPKWQVEVLGDGETEFEFYFVEGEEYELRLEVTLGDLADILRQVQESITNLNYVYRQILIITGPSPDPYRDYNLGTELADCMEILREESARLKSVMAAIEDKAGVKGSFTSSLEKTVVRVDAMVKDPDTIPKKFVDFRNCIVGLGAWIQSAAQQNLELDYIAALPKDAPALRADAGFLENTGMAFMIFFGSFVNDYSTIGNAASEEASAVNVWIATGRDQATIIKQLIDNSFTAGTGIEANLKLVAAGSLLPAVLAGKGPDIYLSSGAADPINYAMRGAVREISSFPDFEEVAGRFYDSALVPYSYGGKTYALPETQSFPVMFYRTDILQELGLEVPDTWDDVIDMLSVLQKNHMTFGLPAYNAGGTALELTSFATLLYQFGGSIFSEDGKKVGFDSEEGIEAFEYWMSFYTVYSLESTYDLSTRFRMGEIPIAIADYGMYNTLSVSAPEIAGLWTFTTVPGTAGGEGEIRRQVAGGGLATMMMTGVRNPENAWEFMKWWSDVDTQVSYGRELESIMGVASRYQASNKDALERMPWTAAETETLSDQWQYVVGIPEVPGGYLKDREISFAVRSVLKQGANARESLLDHIDRINTEITRKRKEFNLD